MGYCGLLWFANVCQYFLRFAMVSHRLVWSATVFYGLLISGNGLLWFAMVYYGLLWFTNVSHDLLWFTTVCFGLLMSAMV